MAFDPREVRPDDPISARAWNEMGRAIRDGQRISGGKGIHARNAGNGLELSVPEYEAMDFQITGGPDAHGGYDWVQVTQNQTTLHWDQTGITGKASDGNGVYPRGYGLSFPQSRQLVLIPPLHRVGNYLHAGQAWLSIGLGNRLPADGMVYHAVRAEGTGQWVFDAVTIDLSTTSEERVYICCKSSSSSSSHSSDHCPNHCGHCTGPIAPCGFQAVVANIQAAPGIPPVPNPQCMNGTYGMAYVGHCTWACSQGQTGVAFCSGQLPAYPNNETSATLHWDGSNWTFTITDGVSLVEWISPDGSCFVSQVYHPANTMVNAGQDAIGARVLFSTGG